MRSNRDSGLAGRLGTAVFTVLTLLILGWAGYAVRHVILWGSVFRGGALVGGVGLAWWGTRGADAYRARLQEALRKRPARVRGAVALLALAAAVRIAAVVAVPVVPQSDAATYISTGKTLARELAYHYDVNAGHPILSAPPPGFALLLAAGYRICGERDFVAPDLNVALGLGMAAGGAWLAAELAGPAAGLVAFGVLALLPLNVAWVWLGLSEVPAGVFLLVGLACVARCHRAGQAWWWAGVGGLALGGSALCRPQVLMVVPFLLLLMLARPPGGRLAAAVALLVGLGLSIGPWAARNYFVQGHRFVLISTNGGPVLYSANDMQGSPYEGGRYHQAAYDRLNAWCPDEVPQDKLGYRLGKQEIRENWPLFLESLVYRYDRMWSAHTQPLAYAHTGERTGKVVTALVLLSYWFIPALYLLNWRRVLALLRTSPGAQVVALVYVTYMVALIPFEVNERSHYPAMLIPLILALAALLSAGAGEEAGTDESCAS